MFSALDIFSNLSFPFRLIEINTGNAYFALESKELKSFGKEENLSGTFEIIYKCSGMECHFECDITIGNVYYFYLELDTAYDIMFSKNSKAVLIDYNNDRTSIIIQFDDKCRCTAVGKIKNKLDQYRSGIEFTMNVEQSEVCDMLVSLDKFFSELKRIKGNSDFF